MGKPKRTNEQVVLEKVLEERNAAIAPELPPQDYFTVFTAEQVLKEFDPSYDEIESGIVDGGGDGGIDALYVIVNGQIVAEDTDLSAAKQGTVLTLVVIQSKKKMSFEEDPLNRLAPTLERILNLDLDDNDLLGTYNAKLVDSVRVFRSTFLALADRFPTVRVLCAYITMGVEPNANVVLKVDHVRAAVLDRFPEAEFSFEFIGAAELLKAAQASPPTTFELTVAEIISTPNAGFVALVKLDEFNQLITEEGDLRSSLFDANVRDYQGVVEVNQAIQETLETNSEEDFWWLNNGISIVASQASLTGKTLRMESPQIVNGLQTSTEIQRFFKSHASGGDGEIRHLLVRVVVPGTDEGRDKIIRATNSQTTVPTWSLRATDPLQRQIEEYFRHYDLFYDRRKNYYKNQGFSKKKIIGIPYLAQAVMAIVLHEPDNARARPSSLLKTDQDYARVFSPDYPIELYLKAAQALRQVDQFLREQEMSASERNNLKFHLAYLAVARRFSSDPMPKDLVGKNLSMDDAYLAECLEGVRAAFESLRESPGGERTQDQIAKSKAIVPKLQERLDDLRA